MSSDKLIHEVRQGDLDNPQSPFEAEMFASCIHAEAHIHTGYEQAMECGLNDTAAKSTGVLLALTRTLAAHLLQHCANMCLPKKLVKNEIKAIVKNLEFMIEENYDEVLNLTMTQAAASETKQ